MYAVIFASGKHSRLLLAYGNSKPPLSGNQGNSEIDGARRGGGGGWGVHFVLCKSSSTAFSIQKAITKVNLY